MNQNERMGKKVNEERKSKKVRETWKWKKKMICLSWWKKIQNKKIFKNIDKDENRNQDKNTEPIKFREILNGFR